MDYKSFDDLPLVLTVEQLKDVLSVGLNTAYEYVRSGQIRSVKLGKGYRIPKEAVRTFLESDRAC